MAAEPATKSNTLARLAGTIQLDRSQLLDLFAQSFVVRRWQIHKGYARTSLLALHKNLRHTYVPPNRAGPAGDWEILVRGLWQRTFMMCGTNSQFDANCILESTSGTTWTKIYTSSNALTAAVYWNGHAGVRRVKQHPLLLGSVIVSRIAVERQKELPVRSRVTEAFRQYRVPVKGPPLRVAL
jgi:hypothetical protein